MSGKDFGSNKLGATLADAFKVFKQEIFNDLNCHLIGEINAFYPEKQTADIQVKISRVVNGVVRQLSLLVECPIIVLGGVSGYLTIPIEKGDECLLFFSDRDIDAWFATGEIKPPNTSRKHSLTDAIGIVGLRNLGKVIQNYLMTGIELNWKGTSIKVEEDNVTITTANAFFTGNVKIEGNLEVVGDVTANNVTAQGDVVAGTVSLKNHVHGGVTSGGSSTLPPTS